MKRKFVLLPITLTALAPAISLVGCGDPDTPTPEIIVSWTKGEEFIPPIPAKEFAEGEGVFPNVPTFFKAYYDEIVMQPTIYSEDIAFNLINGCGVMPDAVKVSLGTIGEYYKTTGCFRASVTFWMTGLLSKDFYITNRMFQFNNLYICPNPAHDLDYDVYITVAQHHLKTDNEWSVNIPEMILDDVTLVGVRDNNKTYDLKTLQELGLNYLEVITSVISQMATFGSIYFINASLEQ